MKQAVLDTDVLSELMKNRNANVRSQSRAYVRQAGFLTTTCVTVMEIVRGLVKSKRRADLRAFQQSLRSMLILDFDTEAVLLAGKIAAQLDELGKPIGRADPMIAAIAIRNGCGLVTGNTSHYERICKLGYDLALADWRASPAGSDDAAGI